MKTQIEIPILFSFTLCLLLAGVSEARSEDERSISTRTLHEHLCPTLAVECPDTVMRPGEPIIFTAKVSEVISSASLTFHWTVSAGSITSGAGTTTINVDTTGLPGNSLVTATVEVSGLHESCANKASCTSPILHPHEIEDLDEYSDIKFKDEQARLDNFAFDVQSNKEMNGYIVCYGGRKGYRGEAMRRCERAKKYLVSRREINPNRLILIDGGYREYLTVFLWMFPAGMKFTPTPTVDSADVEFVKEPLKKRKAAPKHGRGRR